MKKLFLLLSVGSIALSASAQSNSSIMFTRQYGSEGIMPVKNVVHSSHVNQKSNATSRTTGTGTTGSWFSFAEAGNDGTAAITQGAVDLYQDSSLLVVSSPNFYWWCHGLGTSLDPKSGYFDPSVLYANTVIAAPTFKVTATNAYTADSIEIIGFYHYNKIHVDTLFIDVVPAPSDSVFFPEWVGTDLNTYNITGAPDTTFIVADPYYDFTTNSISTHYCPSVQHITQILNPADTDANGAMDMVFAIPGGGISVPAGGNVVAYAHFKSGFTYPFGTNIDSANTFAFLSYDDAHIPMQQANDNNGGLVVTSDESYNTSNKETLAGVEPIMVPTYFYTAPIAVHEPWFNIHLKCPTCADFGTTGVVAVSNISSVKAFPNPAANVVNISYNLATASDVTVTLTNTLGQLVATQTIAQANSGKATFNTAALPAGVYAYSVSANGERSTGSVAIAH